MNVTLESGNRGWRNRLRSVYSSKEEFLGYCQTYNIHRRLGYKTPHEAWKRNPVIEGSVYASDFRRTPKKYLNAFSRKAKPTSILRKSDGKWEVWYTLKSRRETIKYLRYLRAQHWSDLKLSN
jgi:hypothetical protein